METLTIGENDAGQRLDRFLSKALPSLPTSLMYRCIRTRKIKRNGKRCHHDDRLEAGDVLTLFLPDVFVPGRNTLPFLAVPPDISIVYEDENLLIPDKPSGLLVHEDDSGQADTLIHRIQHCLYSRGEYDPHSEHSFAPALCNRLDRNTSGLVLAAKNAATLRVINEKIRAREISKYYLCVVHGVPEQNSGTLKGYLLKNSADNTVQVLDRQVPGARTALTRYRVLDQADGLSLLEVELLTGRTHQIRAQLAAIGHPLAGDTKYGRNSQNRNLSYRHQALCAYRLVFDFPTDAAHLSYLRGRQVMIRRLPFEWPGAAVRNILNDSAQ